MDDIMSLCAPCIGVPWQYHGCTPAGWDCWGLVHWCLDNLLGCPCPMFADAYLPGYDPAGVPGAFGRHVGQWQVTEPHAGAVACFDMRGAARHGDPQIFHVGLIINARQMLHVCGDARLGGSGSTVIEPFNGFVWRRFFWGAMEYTGGAV